MYGFLKRFFDIVLSLVAIIVFSWLLIIIAVAIVVEDKGNMCQYAYWHINTLITLPY